MNCSDAGSWPASVNPIATGSWPASVNPSATGSRPAFLTPTSGRPLNISAQCKVNQSEEEEDPDATQLNDSPSFEEEEAAAGNKLDDVIQETQEFASGEASDEPPEWDEVHPDAVMHHLKLIKPDVLVSLRIKVFISHIAPGLRCQWSRKIKL